jgi:hypothetical protein
MKLRARKPSINLAAELKEAIAVSVAKALRRQNSGPHIVGSNCPKVVQLLYRKLSKARLWARRIQPLLAHERLVTLVQAELKRQERALTDLLQLSLPGFEDLPRRMRIPTLTVGDFLARAARYEKRANRNRVVADDLARLALLIRDQPLELTVPEALARATGSTSVAVGHAL